MDAALQRIALATNHGDASTVWRWLDAYGYTFRLLNGYGTHILWSPPHFPHAVLARKVVTVVNDNLARVHGEHGTDIEIFGGVARVRARRPRVCAHWSHSDLRQCLGQPASAQKVRELAVPRVALVRLDNLDGVVGKVKVNDEAMPLSELVRLGVVPHTVETQDDAVIVDKFTRARGLLHLLLCATARCRRRALNVTEWWLGVWAHAVSLVGQKGACELIAATDVDGAAVERDASADDEITETHMLASFWTDDFVSLQEGTLRQTAVRLLGLRDVNRVVREVIQNHEPVCAWTSCSHGDTT